MPDTFHLDLETRSLADLTVVGGWHYARHPSTEILCAAIRRNSEPTLVWSPIEGFGDPGAEQLLREMLADDGPVYAHNATGFEVPMTEHVLTRMGFPTIERTRWRCTATMARRANIPPSLEKAAEALRLKNQKDKGGSALIRLFSIPRKDGGFNDPRDHPEQFRAFLEYCRQDVLTECDIAEALKHFELKGWLLDIFHEDININGRGMPVNLDGLRKAQALIEAEKGPAFEEFRQLTGLNPTQNAALRGWFASNGMPLDNLQADTLAALEVDPTTTPGRAIALLQKLGFAAVEKVDKMLECAGPDDNFIRGSFQFYGAQSTARYSAKLHQPQNFKTPEPWAEEMTDDIYRHICEGWSKGQLEAWYERGPIELVAQCIRHFIHDAQGPMLSADYSAIEARVLAWLAGEEWRLEVFRTHGQIYEAGAAAMFGMTMQEFWDHKKRTGKHHPMRKKGKVAELACIAEGQLVLTDRGLVPIEEVTIQHLVWDGESLVSHGGVVYQGIKEVITYETLTATPDHIVWTEQGQMQLADAAASGSRLIQSGAGGKAVWLGKDYRSREALPEGLVSGVCEDSLHGMPSRSVAVSSQPHVGKIEGVSALLPTASNAEVAGSEGHCDEGEMYEPEGCGLPQLRRAGDRVPVSVSPIGLLVDSGKPRATSEHGAGPDQQRRALRAGQSSIRHEIGANAKCPNIEDNLLRRGVGEGEESVCLRHDDKSPAKGYHARAASEGRLQSCEGSSEVLGTDRAAPTRARTYDILNCGPLNRFTVSGVLVHNCGYQGSVGALEKMGALDMGLTKEELPALVKAWRAANPAITALWRACDNAAKQAIEQPGVWFDVRLVKIGVFAAAGAPYLFIRLPSGRCLCYRDPRMEWVRIPKPKDETPEEEAERMAQVSDDGRKGYRFQITHFGPGSTAGGARSAVWGRATLYGGKIVENITQAVAFDLMANGTLVAARKGYRIYSLIHDEAMAAWDDRATQSIEDFQRCLETAPAWAAGLPLGTSGEVVPYYRK